MTAVAERPGGSEGLLHVAGVTPHRDTLVLRQVRLDSLLTSPEAFLATAVDIGSKPDDHWHQELESATWAVVEVEGEVCGIAAAKPPDLVKDSYTREEAACFIESVWIDPSMRGRGLGGQLLMYLIEAQCREGIEKFYLWVLNENSSAIELYKRLGFKPTRRHLPLAYAHSASVREIQYMLAFDSPLSGEAALASSKTIRDQQRLAHGASYRLLE